MGAKQFQALNYWRTTLALTYAARNQSAYCHGRSLRLSKRRRRPSSWQYNQPVQGGCTKIFWPFHNLQQFGRLTIRLCGYILIRSYNFVFPCKEIACNVSNWLEQVVVGVNMIKHHIGFKALDWTWLMRRTNNKDNMRMNSNWDFLTLSEIISQEQLQISIGSTLKCR